MASNTRKIVKVFLASPGDLADERTFAKATVDEFNETIGRSMGYHVDLVGWEDTISGYGRPQSLINKDLEQCEYFIGLMWQRWGSPPDTEHNEFTSGFEEEFELALRRRESGPKPEISLFFKNIALEFMQDPGEGLKRVLAFRKRMESEKRVLFETFKDEREYSRKLRRCIFQYIQGLADQDADQPLDQQQDASSSSADAPKPEKQTRTSSFYSTLGMTFLKAFLEKTESTNEDEHPTALEVAKFRLLADIAQRAGNDEGILGVHDANLIYLKTTKTEFGRRELVGLADCGLRHFSSQAAPLWQWIETLGRSFFLSISTFTGPNDQRVGALSAMRLVGEPLWTDKDFGRHTYLSSWLAPDAHSSIKLSALLYLAAAGKPEDVQAIELEMKKNDFQTRSAAENAIIRIRLREDPSKAVSALIELQPDNIDDELIQKIISEDKTPPSTLLKLVEHRNPKVKRHALSKLKSTDSLTIEVMERLLSDGDAEIRREAISHLVRNGRTFTESEAKSALVKPKTGILYSGTDIEGEQVFEQYQREKLEALTAQQLDKHVDTSSIYSSLSYFVRAERHFTKYGDELRGGLEDKFKSYFDRKLKETENKFGSELASMSKDVESYLQNKMTRMGLDILSRKLLARDLALVRITLQSGGVTYSAKDVAYLTKYGALQDIPLLISMTERPNYGSTSLLFFSGEGMYLAVAKAIHQIGKSQPTRAFLLEAPLLLKRALIRTAPRSAFKSLDDVTILKLLHAEDEETRKYTSLKCLTTLAKSRLKEILHQYVTSNEKYYYNVIHWFDFGISMRSSIVLATASRELLAKGR